MSERVETPPATAPATPLRVTIVSDAAPDRNGVGAYYCDLVAHLADRVDAVDHISPRVEEGMWRGAIHLPLPGDATQRLSFPFFVREMRRIREFRPDIVVSATPGPYGLMGMFTARRLSVPLIAAFHTDYDKLTRLYWNRMFGVVARGYLSNATRWLFRNADSVLAVSEEMADAAIRIGARRTHVVGTPVPVEFLRRPTTPPRDQLQGVVYAGRLAPEKNIDLIVEAAAELAPLRFGIAGDGPERSMVERRAAELPNLEYLGWRRREELIDVIDDADLLVLPSRVESFGTVALEAMARGRNVLVSANCGIRDWEHLRRGIFHVDPGETLTQAIRRVMLLDADVRRARARIARDAAEQQTRVCLDGWVEILQRQVAAAQA